MLAQLGAWLLALLRGDLGVSLVSGDRVADEIQHQLGATLVLAAAAMVPAATLGPAFGLLAGLRPGGVADRAGLLLASALRYRTSDEPSPGARPSVSDLTSAFPDSLNRSS